MYWGRALLPPEAPTSNVSLGLHEQDIVGKPKEVFPVKED